MRYKSTRGDGSRCYTFEEAVCSGYAPDGGLFVPELLPKIGSIELRHWSKLPFPELSQRVLRLFVSDTEVSDEDLASICEASYKGFDNPNAVNVRRVGSAFVAELYHGPTFCFKDLGMRPMVNFLSHFATRRSRRITLIAATTGDTGPAAVQAVGDAANPLLSILVHFPQGQISSLQRRQMTTVRSPQVRVVSFEGGGDDMDAPIKRILSSQSGLSEDSESKIVCGINSYNIGRPLCQMVHWIWAYLRVIEQVGLDIDDPCAKVDFCCPTGAMGNLSAGYIAKKIGIPLGMLCAGVNINDITYRAMSRGEFHKSKGMQRTLSEAINIQVPYNFERLLFYLTGEDHNILRAWMETMDMTQKLDIEQEWLSKLKQEFCSERVTDDEMCSALQSVFMKDQYLIDPHTAVAVAAAQKLGYYDLSKRSRQTLCVLSTASPCKFEESVSAALGKEGWKQYYESTSYPGRARKIMELNEVPPTVFKRREADALDVAQIAWEQAARNILNTF